MSSPQDSLFPLGLRTLRASRQFPVRVAGAEPARRRAGALPRGLLGMIALIAAVEWFVASHPLDFSDPVSLSWRLAAESARAQAPRSAIVCVGDSLVKHAVIPKVLEQGTGRLSCNLGIARGPAPATYFLLRRALDAGARPDAVVVDFKPSIFVGSPRYNLRYWQEILTLGESYDLALASRSGSLLVEILLGRLLPSFRSRHEVRGTVLAALRGEDSPLRTINRICRRNWQVNDGANVAARNLGFTGTVGPEQHKTLLSHLWYAHRVNTHYVGRLFDLTAARGIPVYWLLPPLSPALQERREATGAEKGYLQFVRSWQARYPGLKVVDGRHAGYNSSVFVDATHLDGQGATTLSIDLAALLARDLTAGAPQKREVELPAYRDLASPIPREDVEQSRRVVLSMP